MHITPMVKLKKRCCTKKMGLVGHCLNFKAQLDLQENLLFWEVSIFIIFLGLCKLKTMIFIKKKIGNLFRIAVYKLLKILIMISLAMWTKLYLVILFKVD